jgi:DNA-binding NarL/FixJ family response regulator
MKGEMKLINEKHDSRTSILLADDHDLVREAIGEILRKESNLDVTTCDSFDTMIKKLENTGGYDVVMMDVAMPGVVGIDSVAQAVRKNATGAVVLFSGNVSEDFVHAAIREGAKGFIPKTLPLRSLVAAIRLITSGQVFLPASHADAFTGKASTIGRLSPQEMKVLKCITDGQTNKEIAQTLNLSEVTVKMYMRAICTKLGAKNRTHAAMIALQRGFA